MPEFVFTEESTGRELSFFGDAPPDQATVEGAFKNYDALKVASAGPKGSEERRRAMAQEVAAQSQQSFAEGSGGATASTGTTMGASLGRSLSEAGTKLMGGVARGFEMLKEGLGAPEGGFTTVNPEINPATRSPEQIEQDIAANRLYQQAQELEAQAKAFYPVNPDKPWANLPGQAIGSAAQMLATGPARIPAYALSALESGAQSALEAGATPAQAQAQGLIEGAMGGASEKLLGLAPFLKDVGGKTLREVGRMGGRAVGRVMAQEAIQEPTEGILNRLSSKYVTGANPNEVVLDPQTLAMEATGGALGAASIQIPTIGAARIQRQRDVMGRREMGLEGRSEQQLQAELEAFNRGIQQSQLTGGEGQLVLRTGDPFQAQLDLSAQNVPPQFQMVEAPAAQPRPTLAAVNELAQLEQSRQAQFPAGGAAIQPEQPQSILPQGDLMSRLRDARRMDVLRQPSPMSAAALGTGQPVGGPPALNPMTDWLQVYEAAQNQVQTPAPLPDEQRVAPQPQAEAQAPQGDQVRQGQAARRVGRRVNLRAPAPKPQKSSQTITGSNEETASVMPVQPPAGEAVDAATQAELQELDELMLKRGQAQNKVKGVSFTKKDEARFRELLEKNRGRILEQVDPGADPVVGTDINGSPILQSASGTYYTFENGRVRTGPSFASAPLSRSEPAAAQGVATEGAGVSQEETPAFGVRRYGDARFISIAEYNRLRPQVDERIAAGDQVAKRIDELEINAERELGKAAGFSALTPEGQEQAIGNFKTKLYQSVGKWLDGGDFEFSSAVIAKSIASDIGKSKEERARKLSQPGESSEEGGEETLGAFDRASTQKVLPQEKPKAPIKLREETVLTMRNLQRQLGASITQFKNVLAAYSNPEMEAELDDAEMAMLEQARPTLARLDRINYSVVGENANTALFSNPEGGYKRLPVVFLRSGQPPKGASGRFLSGQKVGTEKGVSVYEAWNDPKTGKFLLNDTASDAVQGADDSRPFYLVEGELMPGETGSDGEPLLRPGTVRIIREIKLADVVSTAERTLAIDGSELDDNQIPRVETASAASYGATPQNSISSLIREPIGRSRALQAVDRWKLETGAVGARIEVVEDPDLTTPDGRPVAAMVETRPGELPLITINAAHIASEEEVREKLWHEALHPVWGDAGVQAAWAEVLKALPASAVQAELARGYSPLEATMEAAINSASIRAANTPVRSAWQKFLDAVWEALSRVFGFDTKPKDFEQLMEGALRSLSRPYNQAQSTQYAEQLTQQDAEYLAAVQRGDMATAQRMVDEAARKAGYGAKLFHGTNATNYVPGKRTAVNQNAKNNLQALASRVGLKEWNGVTSVYRRLAESGLMGVTQGDVENAIRWQSELGGLSVSEPRDELAFQVFNMPSGELELGVHLGPESAAKQFGTVFPFYVNFKNPIRTSDLGTWNYQSVIREIRKAGVKISESEYDQVFNAADSNAELRKILLSKGIDSVVYENEVEGERGQDSFIALSPSQIKSADPVTYDDAGNPIPLSRRFQQDNPDIRYSVANSFAMAKSPAEIQKRLETSSDPESLIAMGKAAASLITPEFQQLVASVENAAPGTPEAAMRTFLKRAGQIAQTGEAAVEWGKTHETPIPAFRSINDLPAEWQGVVGNAMTGAHFALGQQVKSIDRAIEKTADELTRVAADFSEADEKRLVAEATKSEAKRLLDGLLRLIEVERKKLGTSSQTLSKEEADAAAMAVSQIKRGKLAVLSKGLETMAREMPIAGFTSNAEALAWLRNRQQTAPIFGQDAQDAYNALEKALQRQPDLTKRIEQIRALTLDNVDAAREVGQLGKLLGKNKGNTIRNYAKLRADYESAFRQFKSLSDRMDRLSNRMDGLLRAKEALVNLTTSPEYNAKLGDVFGNNKTMISGLMAPVTERGQPTGVIEFYGPSAYVANGGIKPGGKVAVYGDPGFEKADGLIYRIDWKPDFAIERKNVEAVQTLLSEIADALYNPESKNALKDPLARASYERVFNYVGKFMVDNRYLTEQQWSDSLLLKGMKGVGFANGLPGMLMQFAGSLYTTRMNAARASGGRGGVAWEEANKAVDAFEKKSENTLRDTRTENAEARRAAIESHGLNPDDPLAIEEWSAHISSVIGSMQNPSQDQLKEGDYVGGMQVTKEDLRSARIQKQFSSGIVSDFNNMATSFAEVVNPEEEIGGILFTRAAEDYGMKTRREFSQWGREFADLWEIATEADLRAFRAKQANATGDEQVQMVWDEREKLANEKIEGPVYGHIAETNSEFTSKDSNQLKAAFSRIRKALKAGRTEGLQTVDGIASAISELTADENGEGGLNPLEAKVELLQAIDRDVAGYRRATNEFDQSGLGGSNLPDAIMSVKAANGALALARGKMVAPTWFYDYGIHDDYKRAAEVANGKRILLMKVYETMTAYRNAVKRKLDEAKREIRENAAKLGRDGRPVGLARAEKEYDKKSAAQYKEGGIFATRRMLEATLNLVEGQLSELKNHLALSSGVAVEQTVAGGFRAFLGVLRSVLLSSVNSIINNLTSTTLDTYRTWQTTNRFWLKLFSIARANGRLLRFVASDMVAALPASMRNKLSKRQKSFLLDVIPRMLEGTMEERRMMEDAGLAPSFESYGSIYRRIKANPLTFGATRAPSTSAFEKLAAQLYSRSAFAVALGSWVKERSPGYFDSLLNRVIATDAKQFTEWLTPHLLSWARSLPGETLAEKMESARQSTIAPEALGVTPEGLAQIRDYMVAAGSLESIAARALNDNGLEGLKKPDGLSREEREAIQFDAGRKYNIRASSTTPDIAKGGAGIKGVMSNILHMFMGWVLQRMGTDATQFLKMKGGGWKKEMGVVWGTLLLLLTTLMAGALYKIPKDIWRAITGNPATTPNILQAVDSPEMALRYLAASTAGVLPVGAEIASELLGGTGISSPLNNNFLDNNPFAGFAASLLATGKRIYQTGDLKYPLVDFTRKNFWPAGVVMNYTMPGDVEARGAARAVRMGAAGMEVRPTGGGVGARETPATPLVRDAVAALYEGDSAAYQEARQKFIAYQVGQGKTQKEAEKRFDSSVSGRDPLRSVLGRQPTEEEEATILRRLTPGQRRTVTKARSLFRKPKKVRLGGARKSRRIRLGRRRPARRSVRLRRSAS